MKHTPTGSFSSQNRNLLFIHYCYTVPKNNPGQYNLFSPAKLQIMEKNIIQILL